MAAVIAATLFTLAFTGCFTNNKRGPLDVKEVSYLVYYEDIGHVIYYVITDDYKVTKYSIFPEDDKTYDYFAGELPSEDQYKVTESEIDESGWSSIVNVLTRVDFMNLLDEFPPANVKDGATYYIQVETADGNHRSGGYEAGYSKDPENRRFSEARQHIEYALNNAGIGL